MCGIFAAIGQEIIKDRSALKILVRNAEIRGRDASGFLTLRNGRLDVFRADQRGQKLFSKIDTSNCNLVIGHSRLITHGFQDNQPICRDEIIILHNGIVLNAEELWKQTKRVRKQRLDSEIIAAIFADEFERNDNIEQAGQSVLDVCEGVVSALIYLPRHGKLCLLSNNGSMYLAEQNGCSLINSESWPLKQLGCENIQNVRGVKVLASPLFKGDIIETECIPKKNRNLVPEFITVRDQEKKLVYKTRELKRCSKCILPETMPFIQFNDEGVCNFCLNYFPSSNEATLDKLKELVATYKGENGIDCVIPFSGGRDSCFALHIAVTELNMRPVAYTYDWGMVTDLGRRNISRMCAELGVESIIVAADIEKKTGKHPTKLEIMAEKASFGYA